MPPDDPSSRRGRGVAERSATFAGKPLSLPRYPIVRPLIPPVAAWAPHLEGAYAQQYFTNFGSVEQRFTTGLLAEFGAPEETCVVCSSATVGLSAALIAAGSRGKVVVPSFTFPATLDAIYAARCEPVLCDVAADTWQADAGCIRAAVGDERPAAIMVVRPFGLLSRFDAVAALAAEWNVPLIVDAAAALGVQRSAAEFAGCSYFEVFSMHASKAFGIGEGGAVFAPAAQRDSLRRALNFGLLPDRRFGYGLNGKMTEFQAAIGLEVLSTYRDLLAARRAMARRYQDVLADRPGYATLPNILDSACATFPVLLPKGVDAARFSSAALERGAQFRRYYHPSLAQGFADLAAASTPVSDDLADRMMCLPLYADLRPGEMEEIIDILTSSDQAARAS